MSTEREYALGPACLSWFSFHSALMLVIPAGTFS